MNDYIGGNYNQTEDQKKAKKMMKIIAVILVLLLIACVGLVGLMYYIKMTELKITIDGKQNVNLEKVLIFEEDTVYIPIRAFAEYVGYESANGDYKQYSEDTTKCYVQNTDEVASFSLGSNKIYKVLLDGNNDYEYYEIDKPVKMINNQLCTTIEGAKIAFNISMAYAKEQNQVTIFTLPYLVTYYTAKFQNAGILDGNATFSNQKALLYDMVIVKSIDNNYGVHGIDGREILGTKYASIKFIESTKEFIVTTKEKKMGIMSYDSSTKISPEYDQIKQIDKDAGLYLVTNNKKQGVINENGSIVIYLEYDQIGIDGTKYANNNIQNQYLLYNNCIPVKRNNLWGLFDKTGKQITEVKYTELGCTAGSGKSGDNASGVLLIPDYEAIVVKESNNLYGLIDSKGVKLIDSVLKTFYSTTSAGEVTYYMVYNDQVMNVISYIETYVIKPTTPDNNENQNTNNVTGNTVTDTNSNHTTNTTTNNTQNNNQANNNVNNQVTTNTANGNVVPANGNTVTNNTATSNVV